MHMPKGALSRSGDWESNRHVRAPVGIYRARRRLRRRQHNARGHDRDHDDGRGLLVAPVQAQAVFGLVVLLCTNHYIHRPSN